jgi:hypothetical protein
MQGARALRPQASLPATLAWITGAEPKPASQELLARSAALQAGLAQGSDPFDGIEAGLLADMAGDRHAALLALQAAVAAGYRNASYLRVSPLFAELRKDSGFAPLLQTMEAAVAADRARIIGSGQLPADAQAVTVAR